MAASVAAASRGSAIVHSEADVKERVKGVLKSLGPSCWWYMPVQTGYGVRGVPDFILCLHGRFIGIETKDPGGKNELTPLQRRQQAAIVEAQGQYLVVRSESDIHELSKFLRSLRDELSRTD